MNDTISLEFARGIVAKVNDKKINWTEYAVYVDSKRLKLELNRKNRSLQLGAIQKLVLPKPPASGVRHLSKLSPHLPGGVREDSDPMSAVSSEQLSEGASVFQEPAPIHHLLSQTLVTEVERGRPAKQSTVKSRMECTLSSKRGTKLGVRRSMSISGMAFRNEAMSKKLDTVQALLLHK